MSTAISTDSFFVFDGEIKENKKYSITLYIKDFKDIEELKDAANLEDDITFWLSWKLFDRTIQSEENIGVSYGIEPFKDTINVSCTEKSLQDQFPLRIFLCSQNRIIAYAEISNNIFKKFPINQTGFIPFVLDNKVLSSSLHYTISIEETSNTNNNSDSLNNKTESNLSSTIKQNPTIPEEAQFVDAYQNIHYRFSIDVRSIGGLKRPSHILVQFLYPHLGSNAHVRSHPMWIRANAESKIEGAVATYDFCLSKSKLDEIYSNYPLSIHIVSKNQLGNELLGESKIDLKGLMDSKVHSVRCPLTNRVLKNVSDYINYRAMTIEEQQQNPSEISVSSIPPVNPILIRALDTYYDVVEQSSGQVQSGSSGTQQSAFNHRIGGSRVAKVRVLLILEEIGKIIGSELAVPVKPGYKMHNAAVYEVNQESNQNPPPSNNPFQYSIHQGRVTFPDADSHQRMSRPATSPNNNVQTNENEQIQSTMTVGLNPLIQNIRAETSDLADYKSHLEETMRLTLENEITRSKKKLEIDMSKQLAGKADDLKRAQEEIGKLELKLRSTLEMAERQKNQLILQEESLNLKHNQKMHELQLLQKRIKEEAAMKIDLESKRSANLQLEVDRLKDDLKKERARYIEVDSMYEKLRLHIKNLPEMALKDEITALKTQLSETKMELERERRLKSETECEKEHYRAQMHRLALALKREREKSAAIARQDLEQLRLEYLAREERYVLDGDKEELNAIRNALNQLRQQGIKGFTVPANNTTE